MMKNSPDHYWSVSVLHCWTLVPRIHSSAFRMTNRMLGITSKQIGFEFIAPKNLFFQSLIAHASYSLMIFNQIFLFYVRMRDILLEPVYTIQPASRRGLILSLLSVRLYLAAISLHISVTFLFVSTTDFLQINASCYWIVLLGISNPVRSRTHLPTFHFFTTWPTVDLEFPICWR